jgi:hypothetical protein
MEDLVEREFSGFFGAGSEFGQQSTEAGQSNEASNEAPSSKLLILFAPRPTNVLYCPNSGGPLRGGQGEVAHSWWEDITYVTHRFVLHAGREMDIVKRLQLAEDDTKLIHELEIYAEGRVVKRKEEFPVIPTVTDHSS